MNAPPTKGSVLVVKVHQVLKDEFDQLYAQAHPGVWFATKQEIAHWALQTPEVILQVEREKPEISGMPAGHSSVKV